MTLSARAQMIIEGICGPTICVVRHARGPQAARHAALPLLRVAGWYENRARWRDRRIPTGAHVGNARDFLRRHRREARRAARGGRRQQRRFANRLFDRAADSRNIYLAIEHIARKPPRAPGPDGLRLEEVSY